MLFRSVLGLQMQQGSSLQGPQPPLPAQQQQQAPVQATEAVPWALFLQQAAPAPPAQSQQPAPALPFAPLDFGGLSGAPPGPGQPPGFSSELLFPPLSLGFGGGSALPGPLHRSNSLPDHLVSSQWGTSKQHARAAAGVPRPTSMDAPPPKPPKPKMDCAICGALGGGNQTCTNKACK